MRILKALILTGISSLCLAGGFSGTTGGGGNATLPLPGGATNYWNYPSTTTFVDTQGIKASTMTLGSSGASSGRTEALVIGSGDLSLGENTFTPDRRIYWWGFSNATTASEGYSSFAPTGLQFYDGSGNKLAATMDNDTSGVTKTGFVIRNGGALRFYDSNSNSGVHFTSFKASGTVASNLEYTWPSIGGNEGQVFTLHADSSTYWATPLSPLSLLSSSQTWTGTNVFTSTSGLTAQSYTANGSGAGAFSLTEASFTVTPAAAATDLFWADSGSHTFVFNPNNTSTFTVAGTSTTATSGHIAVFGTTPGSLLDGGVISSAGSALAVYGGSVQTSSPTTIINFSTNSFTSSLAGASTANVVIANLLVNNGSKLVFGASAGNAGVGNNTTIFGPNSTFSSSSGSNNSVFGNTSLNGGAAMNNNVAIGDTVMNGGALSDMVGIGHSAFNTVGSGGLSSRSVGIGSNAGFLTTQISSSVFVGYGAGYGTDISSSSITGSGNTFVGYEAGVSTSAVINNSGAFGYGATVLSSSTIQLGAFGVKTSADLYVGRTSTVTVVTGSGAGTVGSPTASVTGTNFAGTLTVNTTTAPGTSATIATITTSVSAPNKLICVLTPNNTNTALLSGATMVQVTETANTWTVTSGTSGLTGSLPYIWDYLCGGY